MVDDHRDEDAEKGEVTTADTERSAGEREKGHVTGGTDAGDGADDGEADDGLGRRSFLKTTGTAAVAAAGLAGQAGAAITDEGIEFDRVVNGVEDLGMDPTGSEYVHREIDQALSQSGTLLELPAGTYKVPASGHTPQVNISSNRVGIRGQGERGDVRFVTDRGMYSRWLKWSGRDFLLKNVVYDQYETFDTALGSWFLPQGGELKIIGCGLAGSEPSQRSVDGFDQSRDPGLFPISNNGGHIVIRDWVDLTPVQYDDYPYGRIHFFVPAGATGSAHISDLWVRGGSGSVFYFGKDNMAPITFENCHFQHVHDKAIRATGSETTIRNCTWWYDDREWHPDSHVRGGRRAPDRASTRSIWVQTNSRNSRPGPTIEDCHIKVDSLRWGDGGIDWNQYAQGGTIRNCRFELNAGGQAIRVDSGSGSVVVERCSFTGSSGQAMRGGRIDPRSNCNSLDGSGSGCDRPVMPDSFPGGTITSNRPEHTLTVESTDSERAHYEFTVDEALEPGPYANPDGDYPDTIDGTTASGSLAQHGTDDYYFETEVTDFTLDGPADVYVDGQALDLSQFDSNDGGSNDGGSDTTLDRTLTIESTGNDRASYDVTVTGDVEYGDRANPNADYPDTIEGSTASGSVAQYGTDDYQFSGDVDTAIVDGPATVLVDGQEIQTQEPQQEQRYTLEISSTGNDRAFYDVTVTGDVEYGDRANPNADYPDTIEGSTASGSVAQYGTDDYTFTGDVDTAVVDGPAEVLVDGEQIPTQEPQEDGSNDDGSSDGSTDTSHTIEVSSTGNDRGFYEFSVTGDVQFGDRANPDADYPDAIEGSTASGSVAQYGSDDYAFTGDLESVLVDGPVEVTVDGESVAVEQMARHELEVSSTGEDRAFYEFTTSGGIEAGDRANLDADYPDSIDGRSASGSVALYGTDDYLFAGDLESLTVEGPAEVLVDDEPVDPSQY